MRHRIICNLLVLTSMLLLGGCALQHQRKLFPDIYALEAEQALPRQLDVIVDVTVLTDLDADDLGIDLQRNRATAEHARERITGTLQAAGYEANVLRSSYGLTYSATQALHLVDGGQETGLPYAGPEALVIGDPWIANDTRTFLRTLLLTARTRRSRPDEVASHEEFAALAHLPDPMALRPMQARYLLLTNVVVFDAVALKEAASMFASLAVPVAMAAAGSTLLVMPAFRDSYTDVELVLFDRMSGEIAWTAGWSWGNDSEGALQRALAEAVGLFPAHSGLKARYPKAPREVQEVRGAGKFSPRK